MVQSGLGTTAKVIARTAGRLYYMNHESIAIRNYKHEDFDEYVLIRAEAESLEPAGRCVSPLYTSRQLARPNYSPAQDLFVAEMGGDIVGYTDVEAELSIERVVLECWVHPRYRGRKVATRLLSCAMERAGALGAKVCHVNVVEENAVACRVLERLGFRPVRRFLELRLDIAGNVQDIGRGARLAIEYDGEQVSSPWRHLQHGEEDRLTRLQNRAFAGTWGYNPNTVEEMTFRINSCICSPDDILLICNGGKAVGYCWTMMNCEGGVPSATKGRILMLGVDPDHRGRGIARELALAGLEHLRDKGVGIAQVTVDSENRAAYALYLSLGFELQTGTLWYERAVVHDTGAA